jgi:hypothetical protein
MRSQLFTVNYDSSPPGEPYDQKDMADLTNWTNIFRAGEVRSITKVGIEALDATLDAKTPLSRSRFWRCCAYDWYGTEGGVTGGGGCSSTGSEAAVVMEVGITHW